MLSAMLQGNRTGVWLTMAMRDRNVGVWIRLIERCEKVMSAVVAEPLESKRNVWFDGLSEYSFKSRLAMVLLPLPLSPTRATQWPAGIVKDTFLSTIVSGRVGYRKSRFCSAMSPND